MRTWEKNILISTLSRLSPVLKSPRFVQPLLVINGGVFASPIYLYKGDRSSLRAARHTMRTSRVLLAFGLLVASASIVSGSHNDGGSHNDDDGELAGASPAATQFSFVTPPVHNSRWWHPLSARSRWPPAVASLFAPTGRAQVVRSTGARFCAGHRLPRRLLR